MKFILSSCLIVLSLLLQQVQTSQWWKNVKAVALTEKNFNDYVGKEKHVIIEFFTPWCRYCQMMSGEWNQLFEYYEQKDTRNDVIIAKLNCEDESQFCQQHHVHSFPTIKHYAKNQVQATAHFHGNRLFSVFVEWINSSCGEEDKQLEKQKQEEEEKQKREQEQQKLQKEKGETEQQTDGQIIEDSNQLLQEIKSSLSDGIADVGKQAKINDHGNFNQMNIEEKAELLFDEVHQTRREMSELNLINKKNLLLLHKIIQQADKLQDERIALQDEVGKINVVIDEKKDQILSIFKDGSNESDHSDKNNTNKKGNLNKIEKDLKNKKNYYEKIENQKNIATSLLIKYYIGILMIGVVIGYGVTALIFNLTNKKKKYFDEEHNEIYKDS
uniref:Thioredoxin n=1 Tax=Philasterides dicentrarchi TaxID=282688 RepID=A0A5J6DV45_9CILI|nr:thioredoxin [Philasterides dicentrarchi]